MTREYKDDDVVGVVPDEFGHPSQGVRFADLNPEVQERLKRVLALEAALEAADNARYEQCTCGGDWDDDECPQCTAWQEYRKAREKIR